MNGPELLEHAAGLLNRRRREYGEPVDLFEQVAARWSLTLGMKLSLAHVVLCLIDLKLARLARDPKHLDSQVDVAGYAAVLREPMIGPRGYRSCLAGAQARTAPSDEDLLAMRRAAWRQQGVAVLRPEEVRDDWTRQALINEANRLYGREVGSERARQAAKGAGPRARGGPGEGSGRPDRVSSPDRRHARQDAPRRHYHAGDARYRKGLPGRLHRRQSRSAAGDPAAG
jgi:hypothetical protein